MRLLLTLCLLLAPLVPAGALAAEGEADPYSYEAAILSSPETSEPSATPEVPGLDARDLAAFRYQMAQDAGYQKIIFVVSGVAVAFLAFIAWLSARPHGPLSGRDTVRAAVVTFIAYGGIVLALAYPRNETMTGVIGILSAIAGYVFGRSGREDQADDEPKPARARTKA